MMSQQPPDMSRLLEQAQLMQEQLAQAQAAAAEQVIEGQSGGGAVKVRTSGILEFQSVTISPSATEDVEMLEDLVLAAIRDAVNQVNEANQDAMGSLGSLGGDGSNGLLG